MQAKALVSWVGGIACLAGACSSSPNTGASGTGATTGTGGSGASAAGGSGGSSGSGGSAPSPLDCPAIFDCATKCAETDTACQDACYNAGSSVGKAAADAIVACIQQYSCADEACIVTNCEATLIECVKPSGGSRPPPGGPPPSGSVPADLVGQWASGVPGFPGVSLAFDATGGVVRLRDITFGFCHSTSTETGLAVADASTMKLTFTQGQFVNCGTPQDTTEPYQEEYAYQIEAVPVDYYYPLGLQLKIQQINCPNVCDSKNLPKIK